MHRGVGVNDSDDRPACWMGTIEGSCGASVGGRFEATLDRDQCRTGNARLRDLVPMLHPALADTEARANTGRNPQAIALLCERTLVAPQE